MRLQELLIDGFRAHDDVRSHQTYFPHKKETCMFEFVIYFEHVQSE